MTLSSRVYFRGVDLAGLTNRYLEGAFSEMIEVSRVDLSVLKENSPQIVNIQTPAIMPSCEIAKGGHQKIICLGHVVSETGMYRRLDPKKNSYRCMSCCRKITDQMIAQNGGLIFGIPIQREEQYGVFIYHAIDVFCTLECAYRKYEERKHNSIYHHSEIYLKEIFQMLTGRPLSEFKPASDPRLLKFFNGPLDWTTYHQMSATYTENPTNLVIYPALEYIERST